MNADFHCKVSHVFFLLRVWKRGNEGQWASMNKVNKVRLFELEYPLHRPVYCHYCVYSQFLSLSELDHHFSTFPNYRVSWLSKLEGITINETIDMGQTSQSSSILFRLVRSMKEHLKLVVECLRVYWIICGMVGVLFTNLRTRNEEWIMSPLSHDLFRDRETIGCA